MMLKARAPTYVLLEFIFNQYSPQYSFQATGSFPT